MLKLWCSPYSSFGQWGPLRACSFLLVTSHHHVTHLFIGTFWHKVSQNHVAHSLLALEPSTVQETYFHLVGMTFGDHTPGSCPRTDLGNMYLFTRGINLFLSLFCISLLPRQELGPRKVPTVFTRSVLQQTCGFRPPAAGVLRRSWWSPGLLSLCLSGPRVHSHSHGIDFSVDLRWFCLPHSVCLFV